MSTVATLRGVEEVESRGPRSSSTKNTARRAMNGGWRSRRAARSRSSHPHEQRHGGRSSYPRPRASLMIVDQEVQRRHDRGGSRELQQKPRARRTSVRSARSSRAARNAVQPSVERSAGGLRSCRAISRGRRNGKQPGRRARFSRGKAMSGAPIISGSTKFASPAKTGITNRKINSEACNREQGPL